MVPVTFVGQGNEQVLNFSLAYDTSLLTFNNVTWPTGLNGSNYFQAGQIGLSNIVTTTAATLPQAASGGDAPIHGHPDQYPRQHVPGLLRSTRGALRRNEQWPTGYLTAGRSVRHGRTGRHHQRRSAIWVSFQKVRITNPPARARITRPFASGCPASAMIRTGTPFAS